MADNDDAANCFFIHTAIKWTHNLCSVSLFLPPFHLIFQIMTGELRCISIFCIEYCVQEKCINKNMIVRIASHRNNAKPMQFHFEYTKATVLFLEYFTPDMHTHRERCVSVYNKKFVDTMTSALNNIYSCCCFAKCEKKKNWRARAKRRWKEFRTIYDWNEI